MIISSGGCGHINISKHELDTTADYILKSSRLTIASNICKS